MRLYGEKIELNLKIQENYKKIKKFTFKKDPIPDEKMKHFLDEEGNIICFENKAFFISFLYPEV